MKNINIIESVSTIEARAAYIKAAQDAAAAATKKKTKKEHQVYDRAAAKALAKLNQSIQLDNFDAIISVKDAPALVTLCEVGYYSAAAGLDKNGQVKYEKAVFSLRAFIEFMGEKGLTVSAPDSYAAAMRDAIDLALLKLAQGIEAEHLDTLSTRLEASDAVKALAGVKCSEQTPESIGYGLVEKHLQAAVDSLIFVGRENGTNSFRVKRSDCRWIETSFAKNRVNGNLVAPQENTRYYMMFKVLRRVIAGEAYDVEAEKAEKAENSAK